MKQIQIIGHLGRDAKVQEYNGREFAGFTVAVSEKYTDSNGERAERTDWFNVTTRQVGIAPWLTKGIKVFIQGSLRAKIFTRDNGEKQVDLSISADKIQLLTFATTTSQQVAQQTEDPGINQDTYPDAENSEDLPF